MSPASTVGRDQTETPVLSRPLPYPTADLLLQLSKEIVVDWQLPAEDQRRN
jgi:hypothetical protein